MKIFRILVFSLGVVTAQAHLRAANLPQQSQQAAAEIDSLLTAHWKSAQVTGNAPASDEVFLRRIYLDLAGRIPTATEASAFLESQQPDKRATLINDLLARESYVSDFYNFWADILRYKSTFVNRSGVVEAAYAKFIKESLRANKPYDQFVREMLSAKGYAWDNGAVGYYLRDPEMPLDNMALTTRVFLGTRIECAQCHDHPFDKWKQTEFYHLAAYTYGNRPINEAFEGPRAVISARQRTIETDFKKEKAAATDGGKAAEQHKAARLAELQYPRIIYVIKDQVGQLLSPIGMERRDDKVLKLPFDFHQPDGKPGDAMKPQIIFGKAAELRAGDDTGDVFARWATSPENPAFTRVIVNRLWKKMFGVALTEPLDELRDDTKAMLPEVEAYLEKLMVALHYDMRAFVAVIANTRAYQSAVAPEEYARGSVYHFQGPVLRRMTAEQIWDSLVALANHEPDARDLNRETREARRIGISQMATDAYQDFDSEKLMDMASGRLKASIEIDRRQTAVKEAQVVAHRSGDKTKEAELRHSEDELLRERNEMLINDFIMPLLNSLAHRKAGPHATPTVDETYQVNPNQRVRVTETWRRMHIPGYGPAPKTAAQVETDAAAEKQRLAALADKLGFAAKDHAAFVTYCTKVRAEWMRASELESPAPRGHFLRTMGQSDRDFVENANPNASIPQALALMNGDLISSKGLLSPFSPLMHFVSQAQTPDAQVDAIYLALLSRKPTPTEKALLSNANKGDTSPDALIYALLNTKQFLFVQ
ncbi:hypothetical protein BH11VER1_BH11VER1_20320 [soil metagenome]